jgi:hypothetical protein
VALVELDPWLPAQLRLIQNELPIEDVIEERSMKAFRERCNTYDVVNA